MISGVRGAWANLSQPRAVVSIRQIDMCGTSIRAIAASDLPSGEAGVHVGARPRREGPAMSKASANTLGASAPVPAGACTATRTWGLIGGPLLGLLVYWLLSRAPIMPPRR
jgi:hypothetical protein